MRATERSEALSESEVPTQSARIFREEGTVPRLRRLRGVTVRPSRREQDAWGSVVLSALSKEPPLER